MVSIRPLSQAEAQAYAPLTFPAYRAALARPTARPTVYVGAMDEGEPVAFAFAIGGAPDARRLGARLSHHGGGSAVGFGGAGVGRNARARDGLAHTPAAPFRAGSDRSAPRRP